MAKQRYKVGEFCSHSTPENPIKTEDCDLLHIDASNRDDRLDQMQQALTELQMNSSADVSSEIDDLRSRVERLENIIDNMANSANS